MKGKLGFLLCLAVMALAVGCATASAGEVALELPGQMDSIEISDAPLDGEEGAAAQEQGPEVITLVSEAIDVGEALEDAFVPLAADAAAFAGNASFPLPGRIVYTAKEFRDAVIEAVSADWGTDRVIYLGCSDPGMTQAQKDAVFVIGSGTNSYGYMALPRNVNLRVIGIDPLNGEQMLYTDANTDDAYFTVHVPASSPNAHIIWQDVRAHGRNWYGLSWGSLSTGSVIEFIRVNYIGRQVTHNRGTGNTAIFEDCEMYIKKPTSDTVGVTHEWLEADGIVIRGDNYIERNASDYAAWRFIYYAGDSTGVTLEENATLTVSSDYGTCDFMYAGSATNTRVILKEGAKLIVDMAGRFSTTNLAAITVAEGAELIINPNNKVLQNAGTYITVATLNVDGYLSANYIRATGTSTAATDRAISATGTMTVGGTGEVYINQVEGVGSAIYSPGFSSSGKVTIDYSPRPGSAYSTSSAMNINTSDLVVAQGSELTINHRSGRGTALTASSITNSGLISITYTPDAGTNHALSCTGNVTIHAGAELNITQGPSGTITSVGGNALNIPGTSSTITVDGTLNIVQTAGSNTIGASAASSNITFTGPGVFNIVKRDYARDAVVRAGTSATANGSVTINTQLSFAQEAGTDAIVATTLNVSGAGRSLEVTKDGSAAGSVFSGAVVDVADGGRLVLDQRVGGAMLTGLKRFTAGNGAYVVLDRNAAASASVFVFDNTTNTPANRVYLNTPDYITVTNANGAMMSGLTAAFRGGLKAETSAINYVSGSGAYLWSNNLAETGTLTADYAVLGTGYTITSGLYENRGIAPDVLDTFNLTSFNPRSTDFIRFTAGNLQPLAMDQSYKQETALTGDSPSNVKLTGYEYAMTQASPEVYTFLGNKSADGIAGGAGYRVTMGSPLSLDRSRAYLKLERTGVPDPLIGYAYREVQGKVWLEADGLAFEDTGIVFSPTTVKRQDAGWGVTVHDTRGYMVGTDWTAFPWTLNVEVLDLFRGTAVSAANELTNSRIVLKRNAVDQHLNPNGTQVTIENETIGLTSLERIARTYAWPESEGFLFAQYPGEGEQEEVYTTMVRFTLILP